MTRCALAPRSVRPSSALAGVWDAATHELKWRVPQLRALNSSPMLLTASLSGDETLAQAAATQPVCVQFGCDGVTISGVELDIHVGSTSSPISKLVRNFRAGDYKVRKPPPLRLVSTFPLRSPIHVRAPQVLPAGNSPPA